MPIQRRKLPWPSGRHSPLHGASGPQGTPGTGDFDGPASSADNALVRFDGTTGKLGKNTPNVKVDDSDNLLLGGSPAGASATKTLVLSNAAVPPTTSVDKTQLFSIDLSAGNATLGIVTERAVAAEVIADSTHTLSVSINGVTYKILLST